MVELNENQSKAAYYDGDKYLVIEAGPGAGKTRVLIERIKFLVNEKKIDPSTLLVITFTRKAAEELKERLTKDIDENYVNSMQISTIHAFCRVILSNIGEYNYRILGDNYNERIKMFLYRHRKRLGFNNECSIQLSEMDYIIDKYDEYATFKVNTDKLVKYITDNSKIDQEYIDFVNEYMAENNGEIPYNTIKSNRSYKNSRNNALYLQIAKSYPKYLELLDEKGFTDFNQMQIKTLEHLKEDPYTIYKNILVDEFQDTDPIQMKIFEILMEHSDSFTVVGDIDQSIYGFRGANKNYFEYLYDNYDDKVYKVNLNVNYRSANQIIDISEDFIKSQRAVGAKQDKAIGARHLDGDTYFLVNKTNENEAQALFDMISYLYNSGKIENYNEIAILARSVEYSSTAKHLIQLFIDNEIPYHVRGIPDLFEKDEIKSILTLIFHLIQDENPHNHKFNRWGREWLNLKAYTGENFKQVLFDLSDETKKILNTIQDVFERKVIEEENKVYYKITGKKKNKKKNFSRIFDNDTQVLIEIFKNVPRPILTDENLIRYGIKNKKDLNFFRRLNKLKKYINTNEYLSSDDTILDIFMYLLTDVCNYLTEERINDDNYRDELENLAIISNTFENQELIVDKKKLSSVFYFIKNTIEKYYTNKDQNEGIQIMTVHRSKGLEFPVVILLSLNKKSFPKEFEDNYDKFYTPNSCLEYKNYNDIEEEMKEFDEEEERIVYVAMTRAQDSLILSNLTKKTRAFDEFEKVLNDDLSEIEKIKIIKDIPKGNIKIQNLINRNLTKCKYLDDDFSIIPKTVCEKPVVKKENFLNLNYHSLEDYIDCPFKYKLVHDINFSESTLDSIKFQGKFLHKILENINYRIKHNKNQYIGDEEILKIIDNLAGSNYFRSLKSHLDINKIKNDVLYYYNSFGKELTVLETERPFNIKKEFYHLSGIIDLRYKTNDGKMGILDYKNTYLIKKDNIKKYIKQVYTYFIGLKDSYQIDELTIYAIKARKMIRVNLEEKPLEILLEELEAISENIQNEVFECNLKEDCNNCTFSTVCFNAKDEEDSSFDFKNDNILEFRNKFYENLPHYEIIDYGDKFYKDKESFPKSTLKSNSLSYSNEEMIAYNLEEIIKFFEKKGNEENLKDMDRISVFSDKRYGIKNQVLGKFAKKIGKDHELALELWQHGYHESRYLSMLIEDPLQMSEDQLNQWVDELDNWEIVDQICLHLFINVPLAIDKIPTWAKSDKEFTKRTAFSLIRQISEQDKQLEDVHFEKFFSIITEEACDNRKLVKKSIKTALISIGKKNKYLNEKAIEVSEELLNMDCISSEWIARNALKELTSEKVQKRLKDN